MKFTLQIWIGNDAMQTSQDVADALRKVAKRLEDGETLEQLACRTGDSVRDLNGNTVGWFKVEALD
jgi:hypothetical protein